MESSHTLRPHDGNMLIVEYFKTVSSDIWGKRGIDDDVFAVGGGGVQSTGLGSLRQLQCSIVTQDNVVLRMRTRCRQKSRCVVVKCVYVCCCM